VTIIPGCTAVTLRFIKYGFNLGLISDVGLICLPRRAS